MQYKSQNILTLFPRGNNVWMCCGSPSVLLQAISFGFKPCRKGVKTYLKGLAKLGVERGWFSYKFFADEIMEYKLQELLGSKREIYGNITEIFKNFGDQDGHA